MTWWANLVRRARLRGLTEGLVQLVRSEALESDAKDDAERFQDYGFAGNPGDGQGLVINAGGHTIVLRMDRLADRPQLEAFEVAVWHKEGHHVKLKAGRVVEVDCDEFRLTAATSVQITSPSVQIDASTGVAVDTPALTGPMAIAAGSSLKVAGKEVMGHNHLASVPPFGV